jgi:peptidoglycan/xylan/chitin deacetylase (PgdA/CDA1 family)
MLARHVGWMTRAPERLRILTFHSITARPRSLVHTPPEVFERQIAYLAREGYRSFRVAELADRWPRVLETSPAVVLTFDDALADHRTVVCPILREYGLTATFFVPTAYIGDRQAPPSTPEVAEYADTPMCSWADLREMAAAGFEIGAHSHTHVLVSRLSPGVARAEVFRSKQLLEEHLGLAVRSFAYPKGRRDAFSAWTRQVLEEAGFVAACTQMGRPLGPSCDLLELPRLGIHGGDDFDQFVRKVQGYYDCIPWFQWR